MPALSLGRIQILLTPYLDLSAEAMVDSARLFEGLSRYLDLLLLWNARTNLTAIRDAESIVTRHFGESLLLGRLIPPGTQTLLDLGSGAGFPGLPIQLLRPDLRVTLAESQGKKASFLREVVRALELPTKVHGVRAETLQSGEGFDCISLRAVDGMDTAVGLAGRLGKEILLLISGASGVLSRMDILERVVVPGTRDRIAVRCVPRGTP